MALTFFFLFLIIQSITIQVIFYFSRATACGILVPRCCCSVTKLCPTLCNPGDCSTPGSPVLHRLLELVQTLVHRVGDDIQPFVLCLPLLLLPSIFPSIRKLIFSGELALHIRWPKCWSFSPQFPNQESNHLDSPGYFYFYSLALFT